MDKRDRETFVGLMNGLCAAFDKEPTEGLLTAYWLALAELPLADVERGIATCIKTCQFMPKPVEVRERSGLVPLQARSELAWDSVVAAIRRYGWNRSVLFEDPAIPPVLERMGGWERITGLSSEELHKWARKDFLVAYESQMRNSSVDEDDSFVLHGAHDGDVAALIPAGYTGESDEPSRIPGTTAPQSSEPPAPARTST